MVSTYHNIRQPWTLLLCLFITLLLLTTPFVLAAKSDEPDESDKIDSKASESAPQMPAEIKYRPDVNAIPELYPEKYPGLTALQQEPTAPIPLHFNWCSSHTCSPNLQQHVTYTPLCFLHASLHMLNDRINYAIEKEQLGVPAVMLSRQDYLDYAHLTGYGEKPLEEGGEGVDVMEYARQYGIPDETCNPWQSDGKNHQKSDMSSRCRNCMMMYGDNIEHCWNVKKFVKYHVDSYGFVRGEKEIMNEVFHNGPIQCGVVVDDQMIYSYGGGIYNDYGRLAKAPVDHDITIYGWGESYDKETKKTTPYWVARNSWGSSIWGTNGFFLVYRGNNTMRLEERCLFANVDIRELRDHLNGDNVGTMFGLIDPKTEKPRLYPENWEKLPHDFTKGDENKEQEEQDKLDHWMDNYMYTKTFEERRAKSDEKITVGAPKSTQTKVFEWIFGVTGMICIGLLLAVIGALWLYFSQSSANDGYQPIPHAEL